MHVIKIFIIRSNFYQKSAIINHLQQQICYKMRSYRNNMSLVYRLQRENLQNMHLSYKLEIRLICICRLYYNYLAFNFNSK